jgi:hypothetical protein
VEVRKKAAEPIAVGGELEAMCGKCKAPTRHIIIAKIGTKPSRVECRACGAMHAYRSPKAPSTGRTRSATPAQPVATPEEAWTAALRRANGTPVKYATSGHYDVGQRLVHATFGEGVVVGLSSATVCEVIFSTGTKKLLMGR